MILPSPNRLESAKAASCGSCLVGQCLRLCHSYVWKLHLLNLLCGCPSFLPLQDQERLVFSNKRVAAASNIDMQGLKVCLPPGLGNREGR